MLLDFDNFREYLGNNDDVLNFCKNLLNRAQSCDNSDLIQKLSYPVKLGVLAQSSKKIYDFSCPIICNLFMYLYVGSTNQIRPMCNPKDPKKLVFSLLKRIDWKNLINSKGVNNNKVLYEAGKNILIYN